ncbi:Eco57I restriction-modification methylase domain-containing protein [Leptospira alstonii]|uniref:site-specific DNA-methyltransferase (adenine-specific) n=2 Tax=Leptospira alstonii TaxID=28452 RepID=M6CZ34_9LEPT|nr:Eco57I restriction-modification methylase [Leptospira alstonii serovar Sichuan str. 79601]EQA79170.1 Eco57I restriction-modification methylase [Leptospira alstonii serovar Pingchang str. 80-412]
MFSKLFCKIEQMKEKIKRIKDLCNSFQSNIKEYKSNKYDEANTRVDFIDKFFECLDWDVRNNSNYAESYRDVVREDKVIIEGKPKAPDYSFRIGGVRKFFLEAKKPSVNIKDEIEPAFQIRRYGYTAKLPLSILTDFEEFAIYDTRIKPEKTDKASVGRIFYCTYEEYEKHFEFIYNTFSKEAIYKGSFDKYIIENKNKKGSSEVDKEFLSLIEDWRESLAKNLAIKNKDLDIFSLNNSVQLIIDRIIFLRIAEDRNMEKYGLLADTSKNKEVYKNLNKIFLKANDKYNSGLFKPEKWISDLDIDDKIFQNIIKSLYYPDCPYELSVLPIEILGNIYEQFLGKTIRLTNSHQAKVEEKEEVRKAGGVYYTPQYIVHYIVQNTIGEKLKDVDLYDRPKLTVLDPACGSGSFLVGAYSFLLDKYLESYTDKKRLDKSLKNGSVYQVSRNAYRLSIEIKQNILLRHIFGVDIDGQAVEVTKLSLLLKLMEDENSESADRLFKHSDIKLLPDLYNNIKCGNSLIGSDFYEEKDLSLFGKTELRNVNTFDWEKEFADVFNDGGFDCVIGNPPYVRQETLGEEFKLYAKDRFKATFAGTADLYVYFIEKGLSLLKNDGFYSIIVANKWMRANYGEALRKFLKSKRIFEIIDFGDLPVFKSATAYPCIIKLNNDKPQNIKTVQVRDLDFGSLQELVKKEAYKVDWKSLDDKGWSLSDKKESALLEKIKKAGIPLGEYVEGKIYRGAVTGLNEAFVIDEETKNRLIKEDKKSEQILKPYLRGRDIKRYSIISNDLRLIFTLRNTDISEYPAIEKHLDKFKKSLMPGVKGGRAAGSYPWFSLQSSPSFEDELNKKKIILPAIVNRAAAAYDEVGYFGNDKTTFIASTDFMLLAILNSSLMTYFYKNIASTKQGGYFEQKPMYISQVPIPNSASPKTKEKVISLVEQMLSAQKELQLATNDSDKKLLQQKCDLVDKQIDKMVYELYGLNEEDISIIENGV